MAANGCETNLSNTAASCGGCGNNCNALPGVTSAACVAGRCASLVCVSGRGDCDGNPSNGCEASLTTEPSNCNGCGNSCVNLNQVATATCAAAACAITSCDAGYANCDGQVFNGCETNTRTSNNDCGACGVQCPIAPGNTLNGLCVDGRCNCAANRLDCDGDRSNGCEVNRLRDRDNCGACGVTCISKICRDGACVP
jgi:hypothetical protein